MSNPPEFSQPTEAREADTPAVIALWEACGLTRPWNDPGADFAQALTGPVSTILIVRDEGGGKGNLAGSVMVGFDGHRGWVYYLAVAPGRRRSGLGRVLMAAAETWLRARGAPKIQLMVRTDNEAALGFYEALGLERQQVVTLGRFFKD
jgi:ribosomal protein S18 acetylase RimI-like enzyme